MPIPKYPSIVLVARRPEIFAVKEVVAYEKLHGSTESTPGRAGVKSGWVDPWSRLVLP